MPNAPSGRWSLITLELANFKGHRIIYSFDFEWQKMSCQIQYTKMFSHENVFFCLIGNWITVFLQMSLKKALFFANWKTLVRERFSLIIFQCKSFSLNCPQNETSLPMTRFHFNWNFFFTIIESASCVLQNRKGFYELIVYFFSLLTLFYKWKP